MPDFLSGAVVLVVFFAAAYGWGCPAALLDRHHETGPALTATYGIALLLTLGGVLNAAQLAYGPVLHAVFAAGVCGGVSVATRRWRARSRAAKNHDARAGQPGFRFLWAFPVFFGVFLTLALLPTHAFNIHDDFHTYFPRPFRMLQTGTLGANPFDFLGIDSLGGQSFLHGLWLLWSPIEYLNGLDAVFSFVLAIFLVIEMARRFELSWLATIIAVAALALPNPMPMNISALYSGSVLILALIMTAAVLMKALSASDGPAALRASILVGILLTAVVVLKFTLAPFAAVFAALICVLPLALLRPGALAGRMPWVSAATAVLAILPWSLVYREKFLAMARSSSSLKAGGGARLSTIEADLTDLFSLAPHPYGNRYFDYDLIFLLFVVAGILCISLFLRSSVRVRDPFLLAGLAASIAAAASFLVVGSLFFTSDSVRYWCPILLGALPAVVLILARHFATPNPMDVLPDKPRPPDTPTERPAAAGGRGNQVRLATAVLLVFGGTLLAGFGTEFAGRLARVYRSHSILSFDVNKPFLALNRNALRPESRVRWRSIQEKTLAGETILAYGTTPFLLDFARNRLLNVPAPGLASPWLSLPVDADHEALRAFLLGHGVRYILWEYRSSGMKPDARYREYLGGSLGKAYWSIARSNLYVREGLARLRLESEVLHDDGGLVLFDLESGVRAQSAGPL